MNGMISVIGIGPGNMELMTAQARTAMEEADVIIGYSVYVDLVRKHFPEKKWMTTPMRQETERCELALEQAKAGSKVALICSGDAGVYGMAGLMLEISAGSGVDVTIIPGITAANSGAAVLGAPLIHDYAVISLSDLMTPRDKIERRLISAAEGDFGIVIYNPASHRRADYLQWACDLLLTILPPDRVCGVVRNIGREGECMQICSLRELRDYPADMFSTVFIGNAQTRVIDGRMVTPRGYRIEREDAEQ